MVLKKKPSAAPSSGTVMKHVKNFIKDVQQDFSADDEFCARHHDVSAKLREFAKQKNKLQEKDKKKLVKVIKDFAMDMAESIMQTLPQTAWTEYYDNLQDVGVFTQKEVDDFHEVTWEMKYPGGRGAPRCFADEPPSTRQRRS
eukprot:gnl/MRDRNA2_/MRDRNA2_146199_c0_seq1.p2 gnl/MRDRNA2_/MRDRNA2_146199_c0~~gnl/MRDRNA2_/MRDRNA2_146199_c0_seq1.p2  ORF type:complete len:143 (-),score=45.40 gnl/MRDRNA2_/MRDRNA2_146199_c0_seq1:85-513(-)